MGHLRVVGIVVAFAGVIEKHCVRPLTWALTCIGLIPLRRNDIWMIVTYDNLILYLQKLLLFIL